MPNQGERPLRILHAPRNVAGQAGDVAAALRRLGHEVELWQDGPDAFGRAADRVIDSAADARTLLRDVWDATGQFDVVHFHYAQSLVPRSRRDLPPYWDLPLYRALGMGVFFTFHGSDDIRIGRIFRDLNPWSAAVAGSTATDDDRVEKSLQLMRTYADRLFVVSVNYLAYAPDAQYLPRVIDLANWPRRPPVQRETPIVLHAPTRRANKGTDIVLADLDRLRRAGVDFELRLLEGVSHDTIREAVGDADIVVDNVVAGSYGVVSIEAMSSSRVAVANLSDAVQLRHPDAPVVHVDPMTFYDEMRHLLTDRDRRLGLASRGRQFVETVHDADLAARTLQTAYLAPRANEVRRGMPDWASLSRARRIEVLESAVDRLQAELRRSRLREAALRQRLELPDRAESRARRMVRSALPYEVRARLLRAVSRR